MDATARALQQHVCDLETELTSMSEQKATLLGLTDSVSSSMTSFGAPIHRQTLDTICSQLIDC